MFKRLHPLYEMEGAIGAESAESTSVESSEIAAEQTQETETAETTNDVSKSPSFAKRLSEERSKIERELSEKYKDYDLHKEMSDYLSELNGGMDALSLKERRELDRLEARAEKENMSPEQLKEMDDLREKAAKGEQYEQEKQENERLISYFTTMDKFLEGKGVESKDLNQFMVDNKLQYDPANMEKSFDIAYKAMKSEEFEKKANEKESDTIKRYLAAKNGPKVEGSLGAAASQTVDTSKMSWDQLAKHSAERVKAANTPQ